MRHQIGERVGAILGKNETQENTVNFLGFGVYEGDFIPTEAVGMMADMVREVKLPNPRIKLDNGKIVYGCECWWGSEEEIRKHLTEYEMVQGLTVKEVDIDEVRKQYGKEQANER